MKLQNNYEGHHMKKHFSKEWWDEGLEQIVTALVFTVKVVVFTFVYFLAFLRWLINHGPTLLKITIWFSLFVFSAFYLLSRYVSPTENFSIEFTGIWFYLATLLVVIVTFSKYALWKWRDHMIEWKEMTECNEEDGAVGKD